MNGEADNGHLDRILIVDDTTANLQLLTNLLTGHGYTVYPASDGELALEFVRTTLPDLILLDIRMPGMDGFEVSRRLKADERTRDIPVIFISILEDERDKVKGFREGAVDYITKPFQPEEVLARIGIHLRLRELTGRLEQKVAERTEELTIANQLLQQEVAERKRAEDEVSLNLTRQKALLDVYRKMPTASVREIMSFVVEKCVNLTGSAIGFLGFISDDDRQMEAQIWSEKGMENCPLDKPVSFLLSEAGLWAEPVRQGRMVIVNDYREPNPLKKGYPEGHLELSRFMGIPVVDNDNGRVFAVAAVANKRESYAESDQYKVSLLLEGMGEIIKRKRAEEERERLEEQLRQSQKMEAIGLLAGGVAHDFNNLLTVIMGYGSILREGIEPESPLRMSVDEVLEAAEKAARLTRSLLAFSRKQAMNPRPENLNDIVRAVDKFLRRVIGEDILLETDFRTGDLGVLADSSHIQQVLMNLSTNARDAMPRGGRLIIQTDSVELEERFIRSHGFGKNGRYALLSVSDTGTGMDKETCARIFEPFFTTKAPATGTGLGLAIAYGIVKQHNGYITVYSEPGHGTTFRIFIPLQTSEQAAEQIAPLPFPRGGTETILLAEDEATIRGLLSAALRDFGYTVIEAADGTDAVAKFREHERTIDLLVFDVIMPGRSGAEAYEEIRKLRPHMKVLYLTGYTADLIRSKELLSEQQELLMKPIFPVELVRKVGAMLA